MELLQPDRLDPLSESHTGLSPGNRRSPRADAVPRQDWQRGARPALVNLTAAQRRTLADAWLADALEHHAAVARYARLSLHMLMLAAPPELLIAAQQAAQDKVRHAQLCLGLASAYAGEALGPGPLVGPADASSKPQHVIMAAIADGCVAETLRAMLADAALSRCEDAAVSEVLAVLAREQQRHAGLGWRFVRWALCSLGDEQLASSARDIFRLACNQQRLEATADEPAWLSACGRLREHEREQLVEATLAEVVQPCAEALLADLQRPAAEVG